MIWCKIKKNSIFSGFLCYIGFFLLFLVLQTKNNMDYNPIDTFISDGTPPATGFVGGYDIEATTVIIQENPVVVTEPPIVTLESIPLTSEPIPVETEQPKVIVDPVSVPPATTQPPEESGIIFNQPIHKFMSNANPFFIGIGIVVGLILLGDFFKKTEQ